MRAQFSADDASRTGRPPFFCVLLLTVDDLWITSSDLETHQLHLCPVFEKLRKFNLVINLDKCVFAVASFAFLGFLVSA
jgi:hypothetical protein